ncbi:helix-turn-helix domain-containing protein [uncultured Croceitalea sp.]|uniref:helix-turn-helix domain-containing protein n=1 Tax=uncultured Croceitalea sp. TaxID=1798908 RepID=UPI003305FDEB
MNTSILLWVISGIGALQGILLALLIVAKKSKQLSDRILFTWFLLFSFHLLCAIGKDLYPTILLFAAFTKTLGFLQGPFFLLYNKSLTNKHWRWGDSLHFIPFLVFTILSFFIVPSFETSWDIVVLLPKVASLVGYPAYVWYVCTKRMNYAREHHAGNMVLTLRWIRIVALLFLISIGISILRMMVELSVGVRYFELWDVIRYVVLLTALGYFGLKYGVVYSPELAMPTEGKSNYKDSPLKQGELKQYAQNITEFIDKNEAFLNADFSLSVLSESLDIPKHHLSQIINSELNTSFYNLVNSKRVAYAQHKLETEDITKFTFEGLGYESGFNTKSSFYHNFKKVTGKTPKQYLKEISSS